VLRILIIYSLSEFGCNKNTRQFNEVASLYSSDMTAVYSVVSSTNTPRKSPSTASLRLAAVRSPSWTTSRFSRPLMQRPLLPLAMAVTSRAVPLLSALRSPAPGTLPSVPTSSLLSPRMPRPTSRAAAEPVLVSRVTVARTLALPLPALLVRLTALSHLEVRLHLLPPTRAPVRPCAPISAWHPSFAAPLSSSRRFSAEHSFCKRMILIDTVR
jgi:hypothetical protein